MRARLHDSRQPREGVLGRTVTNNVAVVCPSNGHRTLPATITYLRPLFVFEHNPGLKKETPWVRWPESLRSTYDLHDIPQTIEWAGWKGADGGDTGPVGGKLVINPDSRLGNFLQPFALPCNPAAGVPSKNRPPMEDSPTVGEEAPDKALPPSEPTNELRPQPDEPELPSPGDDSRNVLSREEPDGD